MDKSEIVDVLLRAEKMNTQLEFLTEINQFTEKECYDIQKELIKQKTNQFNSQRSGYKISMTSPETQAIANTHEPAFGTFLDYNIQKETNIIKLNELFEPLLEPELVFQLTEDLSNEADHSEIIQKSNIYMGAEIPDSRYYNWFPNFDLKDLICDNAFVGKLVLSEKYFPATDVDFENIVLHLYRNGELVKKGSSTDVLGNPLNAVMWLNKKLISQESKLKKGLLISSGTFTSPIQLSTGQFTIDFKGLGSMKVDSQ